MLRVRRRSTKPDAASAQLTSPDGRLAVTFEVNNEGAPRYSVQLEGKTILQA